MDENILKWGTWAKLCLELGKIGSRKLKKPVTESTVIVMKVKDEKYNEILDFTVDLLRSLIADSNDLRSLCAGTLGCINEIFRKIRRDNPSNSVEIEQERKRFLEGYAALIESVINHGE